MLEDEEQWGSRSLTKSEELSDTYVLFAPVGGMDVSGLRVYGLSQRLRLEIIQWLLPVYLKTG